MTENWRVKMAMSCGRNAAAELREGDLLPLLLDRR